MNADGSGTVETEEPKEEYNQLSFVEDVSEYRWAKEEQVIKRANRERGCAFDERPRDVQMKIIWS
jgi:hypothetical protein